MYIIHFIVYSQRCAFQNFGSRGALSPSHSQWRIAIRSPSASGETFPTNSSLTLWDGRKPRTMWDGWKHRSWVSTICYKFEVMNIITSSCHTLSQIRLRWREDLQSWNAIGVSTEAVAEKAGEEEEEARATPNRVIFRGGGRGTPTSKKTHR